MFEWELSASGAIFSLKKMGATEGYIIVIIVKSFPLPWRDGELLQLHSLAWVQPHGAAGLFGPELSVFLLRQMGMCEENVVQLRPNFRGNQCIGPLTFRWGRFSARDSVGNVVRTRLKRNMWKHSWSTYLGGTRLSHSQLATAPLWGEGSFVCDRDEVIFEDYCCGRYHMWHSSFYKDIF